MNKKNKKKGEERSNPRLEGGVRDSTVVGGAMRTETTVVRDGGGV